MDKKLIHENNLLEISKMVNKVRNLNETISFDEEYDYEDNFEPKEDDIEEYDDEKVCVGDECDIDEMNDIDRIREIALKGMLKYVKQPDSSEYEILKKIFQFCDKVNNDKSVESK